MKQAMSMLLSTGTLFVAVVSGAGAEPANNLSVIPPIVLQGCAEKVKPHHGHIFANRDVLSGSETGARVMGFDISFVNTTQKVAKIVMIRIGGTDFTKIGRFSPDAVIAWRIAAPEGTCEVRAVRFEDGTEWSAITSEPSYAAPEPSTAPAASSAPSSPPNQ